MPGSSKWTVSAPTDDVYEDMWRFDVFGAHNFTEGTPSRFSRKQLRQPVLASTPASEKAFALSIWRVLLRFMGDLPEPRPNASNQQPRKSVMSRLYKELDITFSSGQHGDQAARAEPNGNTRMSSPTPTKPTKLKRLTDTMRSRLFKAKSRNEDLPVEENLRNSWEQTHYIIGLGILKPLLRDEIYCQICKQLIANPSENSSARGWLMLQLVCGSFVPSETVFEHITDFIDDVGNHSPVKASTFRKLLNRTQAHGSRFQPPARMELNGVSERKPLEVQVWMMDGTTQEVLVDSATIAKGFVDKLGIEIGLKNRFGYSIFISMYNKVASLGSGANHIFDSISQCDQIYFNQTGNEDDAPWRIYFRKELFTPWEDTAIDPVGTNLIFDQVTRGVTIGEYFCKTDDDLALLAAQQYYIEYGSGISEESLQAVLPSYLPPEKISTQEAKGNWRKTVLNLHQENYSGEEGTIPGPYKVRLELVQNAKATWYMQFSRYYDIIRLEGPGYGEDKLTLAVNSEGVFLLGHQHNVLQEISFILLSNVKNQDSVITILLVHGGTLKFESVEAEDISVTLNHIMSGLQDRSKYGIAKESQEGYGTELDYNEGDLLVLSQVASKEALKQDICVAENSRTGKIGELRSNHILVLSTLTAPSTELLDVFRSKSTRKQSTDDCFTFENYSSKDSVSEDSVDKLPVDGNSDTSINGTDHVTDIPLSSADSDIQQTSL